MWHGMRIEMPREPVMRTNLGILALCVAAISVTGCKNDKPEPVGTTTTTSSEIELGTQQPAAPAPAPDGYLATVRREQLVLRSRVDDELRLIDRQLVEQRQAASKDPKAIHDLETKRLTLSADSQVLDRSDERGWDELKAVIEHDLEGQPEM